VNRGRPTWRLNPQNIAAIDREGGLGAEANDPPVTFLEEVEARLAGQPTLDAKGATGAALRQNARLMSRTHIPQRALAAAALGADLAPLSSEITDSAMSVSPPLFIHPPAGPPSYSSSTATSFAFPPSAVALSPPSFPASPPSLMCLPPASFLRLSFMSLLSLSLITL